MKPYICSKCHRKIPREEIRVHLETSCPGAEMTLHRGFGGRLSGGVKGLFRLILAAVIFLAALGLGWWSFSSLASMRRLERIPATHVHAVLPGEINLNGVAREHETLLRAPHTNTPSVFFRFHEEREERDSDGDTRWVTVTDHTRFVDFRLQDDTGEILLRPTDDVDFHVNQSYRRTSGSRRYTEYRIEPGDSVFVFGYARTTPDGGFEVSFDEEGHYNPIISERDETRVRLGMATASIFLCWGGLILLAVTLKLLASQLKIHRVLVYFSLLNLCVVFYLVTMGLLMMRADLRAARSRLHRHAAMAAEEIQRELRSAGAQWDGDWETLGDLQAYAGVSGNMRNRLSQIRLDLARATERVRLHRSAFPERFLAPMWNIPMEPALSAPDAVRAQLDEEGLGFEKARVPAGWGLLGVGCAAVVAFFAFVFGFNRIKFKRCIENLPTSPTAGAAYGLSEFKGVVELPESEDPLKGPLSRQPCVQYHYTVSERRGSGKNAKWVTIINETRMHPFLCRDHEGTIFVDPKGAEIHTSHSSSRSSGIRRYSESRLEIGDPLYAIGECVIEPTRGDRLYLRKPVDKYPFILSNYTENQVMLRVASSGLNLLNLSFAAILLTGLLLFGLRGSFAATDYLAAALFGPLFMSLVTLGLHYNDLVFLRERARRNWSNIDVSLKKRHDLVPRLENVVKGFAEHERSVQEELTQLRNLYGQKVARKPDEVGQYIQQEHAALGKMLARVEAHPELKADKSFAYLTRTLILLENEIALMRNGYNDAVETYNTRIETLPDLIFAKLFHFKAQPFLHAETDLIRIPPDMQALWEKDQIAERNKAQAAAKAASEAEIAEPPKAGEPVAEQVDAVPMVAPAGGAPRVAEDAGAGVRKAKARIYALLLNENEAVREKQLAYLAEKIPDDFESVKRHAAQGWSGLQEDHSLQKAESVYEELRGLSPDGYRDFREIAVHLMEADDKISLFEYAMHKSMDRYLDATFGMETTRPLRHRNFSLILDQTSLLLSRLAWAEARPEDNAAAAFQAGVKNLNHKPDTDFKLVPLAQCTLEAFDEALEEVAHATPMVKANILYACEAAVQDNKEHTLDQCMLLAAIADTFHRPRPAWTVPKETPDPS
ncbi:MAG: LemA family protein [Verrucomicrobia bacterium]|nr:LemA family protein [Verrucomicrobiota bacterium]MCH8514307.1 LemA family protein [Kiritimatiellia bacterium]